MDGVKFVFLLLVGTVLFSGAAAMYSCYVCASSDFSGLQVNSTVDGILAGCPSQAPCCKDEFGGSSTDKIDIAHNCEFCIKSKITWSGSRDDIFYKRLCYDKHMGGEIQKVIVGEIDVDTTPRDKVKERLNVLEKLEAGECITRTTETPLFKQRDELCGCRGDFCNGALALRSGLLVAVIATAAALCM
ncbi:PREDICTED: uncharacterized protein LOC106808832 [Priapulus caudatus]|uniref:Uncharacterized protein LOC106808832 n=1 Tax=Priapulus caudatus TaxID=37621 RepID=A0ABM1E4S6_PRICU|nr:PREDICTED: uncharacterized protein LOC106808832 [Priapulus caudatus]